MRRLLLPFCLAFLLPAAASAQLGGPNAAGYIYDVSPLDLVPLSGAALPLGSDDLVSVPLPWDFPYYGVDYTAINVGANGGLSFVSANIGATNGCLPASASAPAIAPFWDDLDPTLGFLTVPGVFAWHDAANDRFVVAYDAVPGNSLLAVFGATFQVHLFPDGAIELHYDSLFFFDAAFDDGVGATIGIQDVEGAADRDPLEVSCNTPTSLEGTALRFCIDGDGDGFCEQDDCDDTDASVNPDGVEICSDGVDQDCAGGDLVADLDGDGFDNPTCGGDDCDDGEASINPGTDADADGFDACVDCDDTLASIYPGAVEVCSDGFDNDCDGTDIDGDVDNDGVHSEACGGTDCDDDDPNVNPGIDGDGDGDDSCVDCDDSDPAINEDTDADSDGFNACLDCDDGDAAIHPDAVELCDAIDWNCDGEAATDADGDGDPGDACGGTDCDDTDPTVYTNAPELCDGFDQDCDGLDDGVDGDVGGDVAYDSDFEASDGGLSATGSWQHGVPTSGPSAAWSGSNVWATNLAGEYLDGDYASLSFEATVPLGAATLSFWHYTSNEPSYDFTYVNVDDGATVTQVDSVPNNTAWALRELDLSAWAGQAVTVEFLHTSDGSITYPGTYLDDVLLGVVDDADGDGWVDNCPGYGDCDSSDAAIYPGAPEICSDGIDQSCSGADATGDLDFDGFVDANCGGDDCDDEDAAINPGVDNDEDGTNYCDDCDDDDPDNWPGNLETCADGIDQDCDGLDDDGDEDGDGYISEDCVGGFDCDDDNDLVSPAVDADSDGANACEDCNDNTPIQSPDLPEYCGDGVDNDCDGLPDNIDEDGDGHVSLDCGGDDCDDTDPALNPSTDADGDGFTTCDDCDDEDPDSNPDAEDVCDDGVDQDCDGVPRGTDTDGDGFTNVLCGGDDCDDLSADYRPDIEEFCDGLDHNCDGETFTTDADEDFSNDADCGGDDCNDADPTVRPGALEICDAQDNDCDGVLLEGGEDDEDGDGYPTCDDDCDDLDANTYPGAREVCDDLDNDCDDPALPEDERIDEGIVRDRDGDGHEAPSCGGGDCNDDMGDVFPQPAEDLCTDGRDNDCDGSADSEDSDCEVTREGCGCTTGGDPRGAGVFGLLLLAGIGLRRRRT